MAEYTILPKDYLDGETSTERNALLFFFSELLGKQNPKGESEAKARDFRNTFDTIVQAALQSPCFVFQRNQDFEHKANTTGKECHRHLDSFLIKELQMFLPSIDSKWVESQAKAALEKVTTKHNCSAADPSQTADFAESNSMDIDTNGPASTSQEEEFLSSIIHCEPIDRGNLGIGKKLEMCFVFLPNQDEYKFEVHYLEIKAYPTQPHSSWMHSLPVFGGKNKEERLDLEGTRSVSKFSMLTPTATAIVKSLESEGCDVITTAKDFFEKANKLKRSLFIDMPVPAAKPVTEDHAAKSSSTKRS